MILGQRIRLDPNNVQASALERFAGIARFSWNWGLARWNELRASGQHTDWTRLDAELNEQKRERFPWMMCASSWIPNGALRDLGRAFEAFFRHAKGNHTPGYPRFKSKRRPARNFVIAARDLVFDGLRLRIPKLGWVRILQEVRFPGRALSARFTKRAGHWYVSVQVEVDETRWSYPHRCETQAAIGIDLGLRDLAVLSTGERFPAPRSLRRHETKLRRLNKELSRRRKGGANWRRTKAKLGRLHERIANVRQDVTHKLTADVVRRFRVIGIEDLAVAGMAQGLRLAKSVSDAGLAEVRRQLAYKAPLAGCELVVADRFYPSSKTCSACGRVRESLPLKVRRWTCECGAEHDRDENAARNLMNLAAAHAVTACRPGGADVRKDVELLAGQEAGGLAV